MDARKCMRRHIGRAGLDRTAGNGWMDEQVDERICTCMRRGAVGGQMGGRTVGWLDWVGWICT